MTTITIVGKCHSRIIDCFLHDYEAPALITKSNRGTRRCGLQGTSWMNPFVDLPRSYVRLSEMVDWIRKHMSPSQEFTRPVREEHETLESSNPDG
jgi:hypothetical protein